MKKYLEVSPSGLVVNVVVWDGVSQYSPPDVTLLDSADHPGVDANWKLEGGAWVPPILQTPSVVSMRQGRLALLGAGLLDDVEQAIYNIPNPQERAAAQVAWEYSTEVFRSSALVEQMAASIGLSDAQVDDLFRTAASL